jgi:hypothetical protein
MMSGWEGNQPNVTTILKNMDINMTNRTMLNLCGIVAAIKKMATGRNFSNAGINSRHHNLPTYEISYRFS